MKTGGFGCLADIARQAVIINMGCRSTSIANQEDAIMQASRVRIGKKGIGTFHALGQILRHKQIQNAIDTVGRNPFPTPL